jgi:hypothetical protein
MAKQKVLRDFSELPSLAKRIEQVALGISADIFRPEREEAFAPRKGTVLHGLWQGKRLTLRHQRAWKHFTIDLYEAHGKSGPVTSSYGEYADKPISDFKLPSAYVNAQYKRLERLIAALTGEERILLKDLIVEEVQRPGHLKLELIGFARNGYRDEAQARAAGAATITCLLNRIATHYSL